MIELRSKSSELKDKYDQLLFRMLEYLTEIRTEEFLVKEIFLVFQKKLLLANKTKMIQFILFYVAETSKKTASMFVSLLLANVLNTELNATNQAYINSTFYLSSYVIRSSHLTSKTIAKIVSKIMDEMLSLLADIQEPVVYEMVHLKKMKENNIRILHLLQSVLHIVAYFPEIKLILA